MTDCIQERITLLGTFDIYMAFYGTKNKKGHIGSFSCTDRYCTCYDFYEVISQRLEYRCPCGTTDMVKTRSITNPLCSLSLRFTWPCITWNDLIPTCQCWNMSRVSQGVSCSSLRPINFVYGFPVFFFFNSCMWMIVIKNCVLKRRAFLILIVQDIHRCSVSDWLKQLKCKYTSIQWGWISLFNGNCWLQCKDFFGFQSYLAKYP